MIVNFGSQYLIGSKLGIIGIYPLPEEIFFRDLQIFLVTNGYVAVRVPRWINPNVFGGVVSYGMHRMEKSQVHAMKAY